MLRHIRHSVRIFLLGLSLVVYWSGPAEAQTAVTVPLMLAGSTSADGTAILTADGEGTRITVDISGLEPQTSAGAILTGGRCATPGASAVQLPGIVADRQGHATSTGLIKFRGTEDIALRDIADGDHMIAIGGLEGALACGDIPDLAAAAQDVAPQVTKREGSIVQSGGLVLLAIVVALVGMFSILQRRRTRTHK